MKKQIILYSLLGIILLPTQVFASSNIQQNTKYTATTNTIAARIS